MSAARRALPAQVQAALAEWDASTELVPGQDMAAAARVCAAQPEAVDVEDIAASGPRGDPPDVAARKAKARAALVRAGHGWAA